MSDVHNRYFVCRGSSCIKLIKKSGEREEKKG